MIGKIFKSIFSNFQTFLVAWVVILIANQLFIFGACFAPYCLIAGLPHTGVIAALITYFMSEANEENTTTSTKPITEDYTQYEQIEDDDIEDDFEEAKEPFCPKCGSKMVLRTAKKGKYAGKNFWGCSKYPNCNGILNI